METKLPGFSSVTKAPRGGEYSVYDNTITVIHTRSHDLRISSAAYRALGQTDGIELLENANEFALVGRKWESGNDVIFRVSRTGGTSQAHRINPLTWVSKNLPLGGVFVGRVVGPNTVIFSKKAQSIIPFNKSDK